VLTLRNCSEAQATLPAGPVLPLPVLCALQHELRRGLIQDKPSEPQR